MITFTCNGCWQSLSVGDECAGKHGKCANCGATIVVPGGTAHPMDTEDARKQAEVLIAALREGKRAFRIQAAQRLSRYPTEATAKALLKALWDDYDDVRGAAAQSLRLLALGGFRMNPIPLLEVFRGRTAVTPLRECLVALGLQKEVKEILEKYDYSSPEAHAARRRLFVPCPPFACPRCGKPISRVPFWPANGHLVPFHVRRDLERKGAFHIKADCPACNALAFVVWDSNPIRPGAEEVRDIVFVPGRGWLVKELRRPEAQAGRSKVFVPCPPFACPACGKQIASVPFWPANGHLVPFYVQRDLERKGAFHIKVDCPACNTPAFVVWDDNPN